MGVRTFSRVKFRCQKCSKIFQIPEPIKMLCPFCSEQYDFEFLKRHAVVIFNKKSSQPKRDPKMDVSAIVKKYQIDKYYARIAEVRNESRDRVIVKKRLELIVILREKYKVTVHEIGLLLGRHHSSIIHLYKKATGTLETNGRIG